MDLTFEDILYACYTGEPLAYSRWGDGEFRCMLQKGEHNCDKHKYYPDLGKRLNEILESKPKYHIGIATHAGMKGLECKYKNPCRTDIFVIASKQGQLRELINSFEDKKVLLIGKKELKMLNFDFKLWQINKENCWLNYIDDSELLKYTEFDIYLFCAGMMSNVIIDDLYNHNPDKIYLDCGSVFDPYVGLNTRGYHKEINARL